MSSLISNNYNISIDFIIFENAKKPFIESRIIMKEPNVEIGIFKCVKDKLVIFNQGIIVKNSFINRLIKYIYKDDILTYYFDNHIVLSIYKNNNEYKINIIDPFQKINIWSKFIKTESILSNLFQNKLFKKIDNNSKELDIIYDFIYTD